MDMKYIEIKNAIITVLANAAAGQYRVIGYQQQEKSATNSEGLNRLVEVFYKEGSFPKGRSSQAKDFKHEVTFGIELTTSTASKGDLAVLNDENSTPLELQTALANLKTAASQCDASMDELISLVYTTLMNGLNIDLGLNKGDLASRWIPRIGKDDPNPRGQVVILTAAMQYECTITEPVDGDIPKPSVGISLENDLKNDNVSKQGISTT